MSGATSSPASSSRTEKWNRSNTASNASRQSALLHTTGPCRRSRAVGSNRPPFRNGSRPNARAAAARSAGGRFKAPKQSGWRIVRWKWRRPASDWSKRSGRYRRSPSSPPLSSAKDRKSTRGSAGRGGGGRSAGGCAAGGGERGAWGGGGGAAGGPGGGGAGGGGRGGAGPPGRGALRGGGGGGGGGPRRGGGRAAPAGGGRGRGGARGGSSPGAAPARRS